ncbi:MAG: hypothetical protein QXL86_03755 [Candidatus Aenigmatarchaeota archaeon]
MRTILRSGLGLVMMKKPIYSPDLKTCLEVFSKEYPEYVEEMEKAFKWAIKPISNKKEILKFLDNFLPKFLMLWKETKNYKN